MSHTASPTGSGGTGRQPGPPQQQMLDQQQQQMLEQMLDQMQQMKQQLESLWGQMEMLSFSAEQLLRGNYHRLLPAAPPPAALIPAAPPPGGQAQHGAAESPAQLVLRATAHNPEVEVQNLSWQESLAGSATERDLRRFNQ